MNFKKTMLPNGLRDITVPVGGNPSVIVLVTVETGSNYESKSENGLAHFLEHMCFKGTVNRPGVSDVVKELEGLGAQNNAFTVNESTNYYARGARKHFSKMFEIVSDLYLNPTLPVPDIEKEKGVILEEINMYEDLPQRKVWDVLSIVMYGDVPAGRSILGSKENIKKFTRPDFVNYRNKHYVASKTIIVVAGDVEEQMVLKEAKKYFRNIPSGKRVSKPAVIEKQRLPQLLTHKKKTDQTHMVMAFRTYGADDKRVPTLSVLAEILGGGLSSRLFVKLRDEMGTSYYVHAGNYECTDHGAFYIATGINVSRTREVVKVLLDECKKIIKVLVPETELQKAKEHLIGALYMGLETTDSIAEFYASQEVNTGKLKNPHELEKMIRRVTARDVMKIAKEIFRDNRLNLAIVGNIDDGSGVKKALSLK